MRPDHVALLPAYLAAGTAVLVLLVDLFVTGRRRGTAVLATAAFGAAGTAAAAAWVGAGPTRTAFCAQASPENCSYVADPMAALVAALFALLTLGVLGLSAPILRPGVDGPPPGEYCFLLACSMTGGVALGAAGDLITLIVALETLTLPLYILVLLRRTVAAAEGAVTFFVVSVVATALSLLGAALLYAATGALHLSRLAEALAGDPASGGTDIAFPVLREQTPLAGAGAALLIAGLAFKVAAVPFHAWAPAAYDGAPLPVAAYLSTASKLGGVVALLYVWWEALPAELTGPVLAVIAALTMTVGNLVALRQTRTVRLLAWSSVAQAGYILAPLAVTTTVAGRGGDVPAVAAAATVAYAIFFVVLELGAFAAVLALRPAGADGGRIADLRGSARSRPWVGAALVLALVGLAGLPPGLAGLFAKVTVVRALLAGGVGWLAVLVALNAVIGLAYYLRVAATLYAAPAESLSSGPAATRSSVPAATTDAVPAPTSGRGAGSVLRSPATVVVLAAATAVALVVGFAPQLVLDLADLAGR